MISIINPIDTGIYIGINTYHQLQLINHVNLSVININHNIHIKPIQDVFEVFFDIII